MNANNNYRDYAWTLAAVVSMILACNVARTNCDIEGPKTGEGGGKTENSFLLVIARTIQSCVDSKTMNNKEFKNRLKEKYKDNFSKNISRKIRSYDDKVKAIERKYENDLKILERLEKNKASKLGKKPSNK